MDIADQAQDEESVLLEVALSKRAPALAYKSKCHWCDEPVGANAHFCDADCRRDFELHQRLNGGW